MNYLAFIDDFNKPLQDTFWTKRYFFKNYKVYYAYRWMVAENLDKFGTKTELVANSGMIVTVTSNLKQRYIK